MNSMMETDISSWMISRQFDMEIDNNPLACGPFIRCAVHAVRYGSMHASSHRDG